jgi:uncharacterized protein (TIGR02466 family)
MAAERTIAVQHFTLFPTRIWQTLLPELVPRFPAWIQAVEALRAASPEPAGRTNRQGWNSGDKAVLHHPAFAELHGAIRACCGFAFTQMGVPAIKFRLESWVNLHDRGGFNFLHMHEGCLLSGCFYLQVPPGSGDLVFRDPRPGVLHSFLKGNDPNAHNDVHLRPEAGLVALFPSWLEHYVEPHGGDMPRIGISFNALAA